jgi:perosamine synthetase
VVIAVKPIPYGRQSIDETDLRAVDECLRGDWLTQGPRVAEFEKTLTDWTGARYAVACNSGTAALHLAYLALGFGPGDVGIAPSITFVATANAFLYAGGRVVLADVDPANGLIDLDRLDHLVTQLGDAGTAPKIITPVDLTGQPSDRVRVREIASRVGAFVVEDAAHSFGGTYDVDGKRYRVGGCAHADAAILSFHPVKHITTGEGGAVTTNDPAVYERLCDLRSHGIHREASRMSRTSEDPFVGPWYYEQSSLGWNYRITDLQCALGISQMRRFESFLARRRAIAAKYDAALATQSLAPHFRVATVPTSVQHAYHLYVVHVRPHAGESAESIAARRKALFLALRERGIFCQVHYIPVHWQPHHRAEPRVTKAALPRSEEFYAGCLSIPMFPAMTDDDVARVIDELEQAVRSLGWAATGGM